MERNFRPNYNPAEIQSVTKEAAAEYRIRESLSSLMENGCKLSTSGKILEPGEKQEPGHITYILEPGFDKKIALLRSSDSIKLAIIRKTSRRDMTGMIKAFNNHAKLISDELEIDTLGFAENIVTRFLHEKSQKYEPPAKKGKQ